MRGELRVSEDVSAGAWIAPRLEGHFGAVTRSIPSGFGAYARICHPATGRAGCPATWSEVARQTGRRAHALMQWHALVGSADPLNVTGSRWPGTDPRRGNLVSEVLAPLCDVLAGHTATPERCFFCLWDGYGWVSSASAGARLRLPARDYLLLAGPLQAALQIGGGYGPEWVEPQSPNLFWPADQAWCAASEIDFDSTLLGGTTELIDAILQAPIFDSWPVQPEDSLASDADRINLLP
jgi:hypothetical protein